MGRALHGWILTQAETARGEKRENFDIVVHDAQSGERKGVRLMSGGARVWINECLVRAVALYLAQTSERRYGMLFSDETDGALDPTVPSGLSVGSSAATFPRPKALGSAVSAVGTNQRPAWAAPGFASTVGGASPAAGGVDASACTLNRVRAARTLGSADSRGSCIVAGSAVRELAGGQGSVRSSIGSVRRMMGGAIDQS